VPVTGPRFVNRGSAQPLAVPKSRDSWSVGSAEVVALVQHALESLLPADPEARSDFHLIRELGPLVGPEPRGERFQCSRVLGDLLRESQGQLPGNRARTGCLSQERREPLRLQEVLEGGRGIEEGRMRKPILILFPEWKSCRDLKTDALPRGDRGGHRSRAPSKAAELRMALRGPDLREGRGTFLR